MQFNPFTNTRTPVVVVTIPLAVWRVRGLNLRSVRLSAGVQSLSEIRWTEAPLSTKKERSKSLSLIILRWDEATGGIGSYSLKNLPGLQANLNGLRVPNASQYSCHALR